MKRSLSLVAAAIVAVVGLGLAGCSASATPGAGSASATRYVPVNIGVGSDAAYAPFFVADQLGLFKAAGLEVTLTPFAVGGDALNALSAGQIQMTQSSPATITSTIAQNVNITAFVQDVDISKTVHVVLRKGVSSAKDVKTFGYVAGLSQFMAYQYFEEEGIDPKGIKWVAASAADMPALLQRGDIDGFFLWDPWPANVEKAGTGKSIMSADQLPTVKPVMVNWVATTHTWLDANKPTATAVTKVLAQAIAKIDKDPEMAAKAVEKAVAIQSSAALVTIKADKFGLAPITSAEVTAAQKIGSFFVSTGAIKTAPDLKARLVTDWPVK